MGQKTKDTHYIQNTAEGTQYIYYTPERTQYTYTIHQKRNPICIYDDHGPPFFGPDVTIRF